MKQEVEYIEDDGTIKMKFVKKEKLKPAPLLKKDK